MVVDAYKSGKLQSRSTNQAMKLYIKIRSNLYQKGYSISLLDISPLTSESLRLATIFALSRFPP